MSRKKETFWRWRRNPLKRHSDAVEAWVVLVTAVVMAVGMPLAGVLSAMSVQDALLNQRQGLHPTYAVLTEDAVDTTGISAHTRATVRWTAPDGTVRTAKAQVKPRSKNGAKAVIWTDSQGQLTNEPLTPSQAGAQSVLAGVLAAGGVAALLLGGRQVVRLRLDVRRAADWEREWVRIGPQWGRKRA
jgi:hypothetical protein